MKSFSWRSFSNRVSKTQKKKYYKILETRGRIEEIVQSTTFFDATNGVCGPMFYHSAFVIPRRVVVGCMRNAKKMARSVLIVSATARGVCLRSLFVPLRFFPIPELAGLCGGKF